MKSTLPVGTILVMIACTWDSSVIAADQRDESPRPFEAIAAVMYEPSLFELPFRR